MISMEVGMLLLIGDTLKYDKSGSKIRWFRKIGNIIL
jgi:hypothetical protein